MLVNKKCLPIEAYVASHISCLYIIHTLSIPPQSSPNEPPKGEHQNLGDSFSKSR